MSSTSEALVQLAEQKEALRQIANRYLDQQDKLPVNCTLQEITDVFDEYDEYSYMNAFLNSIEVFPDKDYSINDTEGHIKGLRPYVFYNNTALKSVYFSAVSRVGEYGFVNCTNLQKVLFAGIIGLSVNHQFDGSGVVNVSYPKLNGAFNTYLSFNGCNGLTTLLIGRPEFANVSLFGNNPLTNFSALIMTDQNNLATLAGSTITNQLVAQSNMIVYVPSALLSTYQSATNWTTINASRPIQDIESHINNLRELGTDFSFTPYANKKWDGTELIDDTTIGEEVDE